MYGVWYSIWFWMTLFTIHVQVWRVSLNYQLLLAPCVCVLIVVGASALSSAFEDSVRASHASSSGTLPKKKNNQLFWMITFYWALIFVHVIYPMLYIFNIYWAWYVTPSCKMVIWNINYRSISCLWHKVGHFSIIYIWLCNFLVFWCCW